MTYYFVNSSFRARAPSKGWIAQTEEHWYASSQVSGFNSRTNWSFLCQSNNFFKEFPLSISFVWVVFSCWEQCYWPPVVSLPDPSRYWNGQKSEKISFPYLIVSLSSSCPYFEHTLCFRLLVLLCTRIVFPIIQNHL